MKVRGLLCDLDGVVYRSAQACEGAIEGLDSARRAGVQILFLTNNASRPPAEVAQHITDLGFATLPEEVLGASEVAARVVSHQVSAGQLPLQDRAVLAVGGPGVGMALDDAGLRWIDARRLRKLLAAGQSIPEIGAVVQGYGPEVSIADLTEAAYAIRAGATWYATNDDLTLPTDRGLAPGNGSLLAAVAAATGQDPQVTGKPHQPAYTVALERLGLRRHEVLVVGDRLDTDIAGAKVAGVRSALVLTGVTTRAEAVTAAEHEYPDWIAETIPDLAHLWS